MMGVPENVLLGGSVEEYENQVESNEEGEEVEEGDGENKTTK